jgi:hypothetical protein
MEPTPENDQAKMPPDFEKLYETLLFDLHHGLRASSCTILGVLALQIPAAEKLEIITPFIRKLEAQTREISHKHNDFI